MARSGVWVFIPELIDARSGVWLVLMIGMKSGRRVGLWVDFRLISISAEPVCEVCRRGQSTRKKGDEGPRKQLGNVRGSGKASGACGMSAVLAGQVEVGAAQ